MTGPPSGDRPRRLSGDPRPPDVGVGGVGVDDVEGGAVMDTLTGVLAVLVLVWILSSICVGWAAGVRGRPGIAWTIIAVAISPGMAALVLIAAGPMTTEERERKATVDQQRKEAEELARTREVRRGL